MNVGTDFEGPADTKTTETVAVEEHVECRCGCAVRKCLPHQVRGDLFFFFLLADVTLFELDCKLHPPHDHLCVSTKSWQRTKRSILIVNMSTLDSF